MTYSEVVHEHEKINPTELEIEGTNAINVSRLNIAGTRNSNPKRNQNQFVNADGYGNRLSLMWECRDQGILLLYLFKTLTDASRQPPQYSLVFLQPEQHRTVLFV